MKKKLYLHIGTNKTGTSSIQKYCNSQREILAKVGLLYPRAGCSGEAHYGLSSALGFTHSRIVREERVALLEDLRKELFEELDLYCPESVVFSSENFVLGGDPVEVAEFLADFDVYILVYLRRHDGWWPSAYQQAVRQVKLSKWGIGLESFISFQNKHNPRYGDYRYLLDRWATVFGKDKILVRPYEAQQNQPHIVGDFFRTLTREDLITDISPRVNESLDAWSLRMIEISQHANIDNAVRHKIIDFVLSNPHGGDRFRAAPGVLRKFIAQHQKDYEYIAREYLAREDGRLYYDPLPEGEGNVSNAHPTPREVMAWTVKALMEKEVDKEEIQNA